jgi:16S rRNA (guanine966-N2)-methyltransferase
VPAGTRPLSDRAREGLFSSLGDDVPGAVCADLYAGTGAVGIEALSRGAASCVFVESSAPAIRTIRRNLELAHLEAEATVARGDVRAFLERREEPLDVAFLDPPYAIREQELGSVLTSLTDRLEANAVFVLTRPKGRDSIDVIPLHWRSAKLLSYGDARILVCRRQP